MICKNCQRTIEMSYSLIHNAPKWRHETTQMFTCFDGFDRPQKNDSGEYDIAEPVDCD